MTQTEFSAYELDYVELVLVSRSPVASLGNRFIRLIVTPNEAIKILKERIIEDAERKASE